MKSFLAFIIPILILPAFGQSQIDTLRQTPPGWDYPDIWLHRWAGPRFAQMEKSIGLVPSIQSFSDLYVGLGIARGRFMIGEGGGAGVGTTLGYGYNPLDNVHSAKMNLWATGFGFFFGGNVGVSGEYYFDQNNSAFAFKPEIGIGYLKVFLNYGRNYFVHNNMENLPKNTLTFSCYITILPKREK